MAPMIRSLVLLAALCLTLAGCGQPAPADAPAANDTVTPSQRFPAAAARAGARSRARAAGNERGRDHARARRSARAGHHRELPGLCRSAPVRRHQLLSRRADAGRAKPRLHPGRHPPHRAARAAADRARADQPDGPQAYRRHDLDGAQRAGQRDGRFLHHPGRDARDGRQSAPGGRQSGLRRLLPGWWRAWTSHAASSPRRPCPMPAGGRCGGR